MPDREQAQHLARRLHALSGGPEVLRKAAARELARRDPTDATELIHHLLALVRDGWEPAACVLSAFAAALTQEAAQIPYAHALKRLAELQDLTTVSAFLADGSARLELDEGAARRKDAQLTGDTLGHQKTRARSTTDRDLLVKLLGVSHPDVVRNALMNPRLTEPLVVQAAARRPSRPEPLEQIFLSPKWGVRHDVRRALVFNPYFPLELGAKLVPLLNEADLREVAQSAQVHEALRAQAQELLRSARGRARPKPPPEPVH